jgi:hypothetical protein
VAELAEAQTRMIARISRSQKPMAIVGSVLALLGIAYLGWGVMRFNPHGDPRANPGFDWPVARLAFIFDRGHAQLDRAQEGTPSEKSMVRRVKRNMEFSAGVMVFLLRVFLGTLTLVLGLAIVTIVVERARLITMLRRLQE